MSSNDSSNNNSRMSNISKARMGHTNKRVDTTNNNPIIHNNNNNGSHSNKNLSVDSDYREPIHPQSANVTSPAVPDLETHARSKEEEISNTSQTLINEPFHTTPPTKGLPQSKQYKPTTDPDQYR